MNPETILQIIKLSLELAIRIHDDMPQSQRNKFWERHEKNLEFWESLFMRLQPKDTP